MAQSALKALLIIFSAALTFILMPWVPLYSFFSSIAFKYLTFSQAVNLTTSFDGTKAPEAYDTLINTVMLFIYVICCGFFYSIIKTIFNSIKYKTKTPLQDFIKLSILRILKPVFFLIIIEVVLYLFPNKIADTYDYPPYWMIIISFALILIASSIIYFSLKQVIKKGRKS